MFAVYFFPWIFCCFKEENLLVIGYLLGGGNLLFWSHFMALFSQSLNVLRSSNSKDWEYDALSLWDSEN